MTSNGIVEPKSTSVTWTHDDAVDCCLNSSPGARPTNDIAIEFEIRSKFGVLFFKICSTDHNKILHMSRQLLCCDVCKISLWLVEYFLNQSTVNFDRISNLIEISLVGWPPGLYLLIGH